MGKSFTVNYDGKEREFSFKKTSTDPVIFDVDVEDRSIASMFGDGILYINGDPRPTIGTLPLSGPEEKLLRDIYKKILEMDK